VALANTFFLFLQYIEHYLLDQQSRDVQEAAVLVSQLQRVGKGLGVFEVRL
jgi:hypothetical protein